MAIRRVISIETGPLNTKISKIDYGKPDGKIRKAIEFATPEGAIEDGYVRDRDSFLYALRREMKAGNFGKGFLVFTINSSRVLSREVTLPFVSYRMLPGLIESGKEEYFPVDVSEHDLAYTVVEANKKKKVRRLMIYAVPKKLVQQYAEIANKLGCKLVAIDFAGNSLNQWVRRSIKTMFTEKLNILMQINDQNTLVTIIDNKNPVLQRNVNFGTRNVLDVVRELYPDEELTYEEAYAKFLDGNLIQSSFGQAGLPMQADMTEGMSEGMSADTPADRHADRHADMSTDMPLGMDPSEWAKQCKVRTQVTEALRPLILNLTRMIEFYATKNKTEQVEMIRVIGSGLRLEGLIPLMNNEIGITVQAMDDGLNEQLKRRVRVRRSSDLATCFGSALSPIYYISKSFHDGESYWVVAACILVLTGFGAYYGNAFLQDKLLEQEQAVARRDQLITEREDRKWVIEEKAEFEKFLSEQSEMLAMHDLTFTYNEQLKELILLLEKQLPSSTVIHSMSSAGDLLTLSVTVKTKADAEKLLYQMKRIPFFSAVEISGITETEAEPGMTTVSFSLSCTLTVPPEPRKAGESGD